MTPRTTTRRLYEPPPLINLIIAGTLALMFAGCSHGSVENYLTQGDKAMQNTKLADAESAYQQAIKLAPNDPRGHVALGNLYVFEQKAGPAELEFMKVIDLDPHNPAAHAALGNTYSSQSKLGVAEAQYRAAVALAPVNTSYRLSLGTTLQKEGKMSEAEAQLRTATGLEPKNAHAHLALAGLLSAEPNRQTEAEAEYAQVKALDPSLLPAAAAPSPVPATVPTTATAAPAPLRIRDVNRKFKLTHDSPVYATPSADSQVVAKVHRSKFVHVTGIAGTNWLRIAMRNGTVGFIPVTAAE
ncbi:MAG: tetratricopeptide repeat protein [Candidatus Binataceae bacterium]